MKYKTGLRSPEEAAVGELSPYEKGSKPTTSVISSHSKVVMELRHSLGQDHLFPPPSCSEEASHSRHLQLGRDSAQPSAMLSWALVSWGIGQEKNSNAALPTCLGPHPGSHRHAALPVTPNIESQMVHLGSCLSADIGQWVSCCSACISTLSNPRL